MNHDLLQIAGALLVLTAFALTQLGVLSAKAVAYLIINIIGAGLLAWLAWTSRDWGFLLLEGVWAAVSAVSLAAVALGRNRERTSGVGTARPAR